MPLPIKRRKQKVDRGWGGKARSCLAFICLLLSAVALYECTGGCLTETCYAQLWYERYDAPLLVRSTSDEGVTYPFLGCEEISQLPILSVLGQGKSRAALEVLLPWGGVGLAKRCVHNMCLERTHIETSNLAMMRDHYGSATLGFYGKCNKTQAGASPTLLKKQLSNFFVGPTIIVERGEPLRKRWEDNDIYNFSTAEVLDLDRIAHQFAFHPMGPFLLGRDCQFPQQYAHFESGLHLIDLEGILSSNVKSKLNITDPLVALDMNRCVVLQHLAHLTFWNGTEHSYDYCQEKYSMPRL